jgi:hypothetical protein
MYTDDPYDGDIYSISRAMSGSHGGVTAIGSNTEVTAAIIARPVDTGIPFVLLQGLVSREPYRAAITIRHGMVVVRCEEAEARSQKFRVYMETA